MTPRERYDALLKQTRSQHPIVGPLGIPGWKKVSRKTMVDLYHAGKLPVKVALAYGMKDADHAKMLSECPKYKLNEKVVELLKNGIDFKKLRF